MENLGDMGGIKIYTDCIERDSKKSVLVQLYGNVLMQYTEIFKVVKYEDFQ